MHDFSSQHLNCNIISAALDSGLERVAKPRALPCHRHSLITAWTCSAGPYGSQGVWSPNHLGVLLAPVVVIYTRWPPDRRSLFEAVCRPNNCFVFHLKLSLGSCGAAVQRVSAFTQLGLHEWCVTGDNMQKYSASDQCKLSVLIFRGLFSPRLISCDLSEDDPCPLYQNFRSDIARWKETSEGYNILLTGFNYTANYHFWAQIVRLFEYIQTVPHFPVCFCLFFDKCRYLSISDFQISTQFLISSTVQQPLDLLQHQLRRRTTENCIITPK